MWKRLTRKRLAVNANGNAPLATDDVARAGSVLFAVFARYGDSVITFKLLREFARAYPDKKYLLITSPQALPYAEAILPSSIRCVGFDKHRDVFGLWRLTRLLKREPFDIGFNPWSHGLESEYFISFARRFHAYGAFADFPRTHNLYDRARSYLGLAVRPAALTGKIPTQPKRILISPFSTDVRKSLDADDLKKLVAWIGKRYENASLALALFPKEDEKVGDLPLARFYFGKSRKRSRAFLDMVKGSDLFVGVDAGPLHLADALGIPSIGIFGPTAPETILDRDSGIVPLRLNAMQSWFCDIRDCADPLCLHRLLAGTLLPPAPVDFTRPATFEIEVCRAKG
ncbi:MAG TPA: glycosyltransferase family 9 protein [Burkholderiales bacterium]|nr:glycosyltransferase family 9 protein [Burkholderiales bacterium]